MDENVLPSYNPKDDPDHSTFLVYREKIKVICPSISIRLIEDGWVAGISIADLVKRAANQRTI